MKEYKKRVADGLLKFKLSSKGAVLIEGAKWCGKTTTAGQQAASTVSLMGNTDAGVNVAELAALNPYLILKGGTPRLIDEWQEQPRLWDAVRAAVDERGEFGQFILTGSAVPGDLTKIRHSGVGRFTRLLMRPMSLLESGESSAEVSLTALFEGEPQIQGQSSLDINALAFLICRGGWPAALDCPDAVALVQARDYLEAVINSDISRVSHRIRNKGRLAALLRSYARSTAAPAKLSTLVEDLSAKENMGVTDETLASYVQILKQIFVVEDAPAWNPNLRSKAAIRTADNRYFTDPSIAAAALDAGPADLINDIRTMGLLFENLCVRDLRVYADALDATVYHYRDSNGLECDAVLHRRNGTYGLIEIKLGGEQRIEEAAAALQKLERSIDTAKMKAPAFKMVLTGIGKYAYRRDDGVLVVPVGTLGV